MRSKFTYLMLASLLGFLNLVSAHGDESTELYASHHGGMMSGFYGGFGFMWLFGWVFMILVIVTLILFIVWLFKQIQKPERRRK